MGKPRQLVGAAKRLSGRIATHLVMQSAAYPPKEMSAINDLQEHWHGLHLASADDSADGLTQYICQASPGLTPDRTHSWSLQWIHQELKLMWG